jgi:hypothetical protein
VVAITLVLFGAALFYTGLTHDLLLEAGVFLVSVKLIMMAYKSSVSNDAVKKKLDEIHSAVQRLEQAGSPVRESQPQGPPSGIPPEMVKVGPGVVGTGGGGTH